MKKANVLPDEFFEISGKIQGTKDFNFNLKEYLESSSDFSELINSMEEKPAMYSYFFNAYVHQERYVAALEDGYTAWFNEQYSKLEPGGTETAKKSKIQNSKFRRSKTEECPEGEIYVKHEELQLKIKDDRMVLRQLEVAMKSIEKKMNMLQSLGAMSRTEATLFAGEFRKKEVSKSTDTGIGNLEDE